MAFYTDESIAAVFPQAADLPADQVTQALQDAGCVYTYAQTHAGISEADLRAWGETQSFDPDRMTLALQLLQGAGKLFALPDAGPLPLPAQPQPAQDQPGAPARTTRRAAKPRRSSSRKASR